MARLEFHPLSELRAEAASLLAERYARQRVAEPLLPEVAEFEPQLPPDGLVATRGGKAVAYLADEHGELRKPSFAGHAAHEPEALRDLWTELATGDQFAVTVPATDPALVDAWFRLAFGCQFMWAVQEVKSLEPVEFGGTIRPVVPDDLEAIVDLDWVLRDHQILPPSYSDMPSQTRDEARIEAAELWEEGTSYVTFIAELDGNVVGMILLYPRPMGDLRVPEDNIDLSFASTLQVNQGRGVGIALYTHAMNWADDQGFRSMTVDWRSVNLLASRFWPKRGFRPTYFRLYRRVP